MSKGRLARFTVSVVTAGALVVVAAACGGSSSAKTAATSTTAVAGGVGANRAAFVAYRACLSQHGVTLPQRTGPTGGPPPSDGGAGGFPGAGGFGGGFGGTPQSLPKGVTATQFAAAQTACRSKLPTGGLFGGGGRGGAAFQAYASCLSDHGVTISRVAPQTTVAGSPRPTFNRNDPKFIAANKVCAALLPSRTTTTTAG